VLLEQQRRVLDGMSASDAEKQAKVELQKRIQQAVIAGTGWDGVPEELRRQAETPWFQSFLRFDPSRVMNDVRQPVLVVHGELDRQTPVWHADRLASMARARERAVATDLVKVQGVNHLLVPAKTGEIEEYESLKGASVSREATDATVDWLVKTLPAASR
jgi:fermentation-respiration switch protein FrsA (DUF1100 family)